MGSNVWGGEIAEVYDATYAALAEPSVVDPMVDLLAALAGDGAALEFAVGTGRIALPLSARGTPVRGIELSPDMVEQLRRKPGGDAVPVTIGDMTSTRLPDRFELVYLVANSIMNVTTQEEQIAVFSNAAAHLVIGGHFVIELIVPQLRRVPPSEAAWVFRLDADHVGIETFDDVVGQVASVPSLDRGRRPPGASLSSLPVHLAVGATPHGEDHWFRTPGSLGRLGGVALHFGERKAGHGLRQDGTSGPGVTQ